MLPGLRINPFYRFFNAWRCYRKIFHQVTVSTDKTRLYDFCLPLLGPRANVKVVTYELLTRTVRMHDRVCVLSSDYQHTVRTFSPSNQVLFVHVCVDGMNPTQTSQLKPWLMNYVCYGPQSFTPYKTNRFSWQTTWQHCIQNKGLGTKVMCY